MDFDNDTHDENLVDMCILESQLELQNTTLSTVQGPENQINEMIESGTQAVLIGEHFPFD
jgi:hypothetical protein